MFRFHVSSFDTYVKRRVSGRRFVPVDADGRGRIGAYVRHALDKLLHSRRLKVRVGKPFQLF